MSILRGDQNACWHTFKEILSIGTSLPIAIISYALFLVWVNGWTSDVSKRELNASVASEKLNQIALNDPCIAIH